MTGHFSDEPTENTPDGGIDRRRFLQAGGVALGAAAVAGALPATSAGAKEPGSGLLRGTSEKAPFSFTYGGTPSAQLLPRWRRSRQRRSHGNGRTETTTTWTDPDSGLQVRWVRTTYRGFPTVSWVVHFHNTGSSRSAVLADVLAADVTLDSCPAGNWTIHCNNGSAALPTDFAPYELPLSPQTFRLFSCGGGRPTNGYHNPDLSVSNIGGGWPYFNIDFGSGGVIAAIGWPGQWAMEVKRADTRTLQLRGGMSQGEAYGPGDEIEVTDLTSLWLGPGESIRTPTIVLLPWRGGDWLEAQNVWRRWFVQQHMPHVDGKPVAPLLPTQSNDYFPNQYDTAQDELDWLNAYGQHHATTGTGGPADHWWIDAGWSKLPPGATDWNHPGSWVPDPTRYPDGLRPIDDRAHQLGMRTIVWFEPERVRPDTWLYDTHPEWLLKSSPGQTDNFLLNFADPAVQDWAINHMSGLIASQHIDVYREDFNVDPLPFWTYNDPPDRRGITQIRYVEGHLRYWRTLQQRHHGLVIDTCASGGRRLDLETMSIAVNLLRSDYVLDPLGNQVHQYGITHWIALSGGAARLTGSPDDAYNARSSMSPSFHFAVDVNDPNAPWDAYNQLGAEWHRIAGNLYGDYYPLLPFSADQNSWTAWSFHRPHDGVGHLQAFRRPQSTTSQQRLTLRGLDPGRRYRLTDEATGTVTTARGRDLMHNGLLVTLPTAPSATTIRWHPL